MSMNEKPRLTVKSGKGRTKQSFEKQCNINNILARYRKDGHLAHITNQLISYEDISERPSLHEAMNVAAEAKQAFMTLPAQIRAACDHDAGNFLEYINDPENHEEATEFGLFREKEVEESEEKFVPSVAPEAEPNTTTPVDP